MNTGELNARLVQDRMLAIVRVVTRESLRDVLSGMAAGGIGLVEISLVTPGALAAIRAAAEGPSRIGAGTVRTATQAREAIAAGAAFLVAPGYDPWVHEIARAADIAYLPGVMTPTEVDRALQAGVELLKLFPAGHLGPDYLRALLAPFPSTTFVATGGVDARNAQAFLDAGAVAVALGSALLPPTSPTVETVGDLARTVRLSLRSKEAHVH